MKLTERLEASMSTKAIRKKGKLKLCLQFFLAQIREKLYEVVCEKNGQSNKKTLSSTVQSTNIM